MKAVVISVSGVARNGSRARKTPQNRARKILTRDMFGGPPAAVQGGHGSPGTSPTARRRAKKHENPFATGSRSAPAHARQPREGCGFNRLNGREGANCALFRLEETAKRFS